MLTATPGNFSKVGNAFVVLSQKLFRKDFLGAGACNSLLKASNISPASLFADLLTSSAAFRRASAASGLPFSLALLNEPSTRDLLMIVELCMLLKTSPI